VKPFPRRACPLWFEIAIAIILAALVRELAPAAGQGDAAPVLLGFWSLIFVIASAVWKGLEVAGKVTLEVLKWSVLQLWTFARSTYNGLLTVGKDLLKGARRAWDFFEATYEHVLKPAWDKFHEWYRRARQWLTDVFGPVIKFLQFLRSEFLKFYDKWVRPILDAIDIGRKVLRLFAGFGWEWAAKLDRYLAKLQERIDLPFRYILGKINEVITIVNRVVTLDGLLQRLALVRSIERDIRLVTRAFANWRSKPLTEDEFTKGTIAALIESGYSESDARAEAARRYRSPIRSEAEIWQAFIATVEPGGARRDPHAAEIAAQWRLALEKR
jgi:hypothetical protein